MSSPTPELNTSIFHARNIKRGLIYFAMFTFAGLTALFLYTQTPQTLDALTHMEVRFMLVAALLSMFDLWLGGFRNHIFVRKIKPGVSQWLCYKANLANLFMGAVTPSQTGGGPAQLFVLYRGGISLPSGISVSVINFISTLTFFLISATFALIVIREKFSEGVIRYLVQYGYSVVVVMLAFFLFALWRPDMLSKIVRLLGRGIARLNRNWAKKILRGSHFAVTKLNEFHETCILFIKSEPWLLPYSLFLTILMYTNKFTLAYFVMRGLGVEGDFISVLAIQAVIIFILYAAPSPGGSGIAEISTGALMSMLMPAYLLPIFTLIYRFFLLYLPATMGAFVMMRVLHSTAPIPADE